MIASPEPCPARPDLRHGHLAALLALLLLASPALADRTVEGRVTVVRDVDRIIVSGTPIRLNGVDGPETSTRYGREARAFMTRLVQGEMVVCSLNGDRTYDRWVGILYRPSGTCSC